LQAVGLPDWQVGFILGAFGIASLVCRPLALFALRLLQAAGYAAFTTAATALVLVSSPVLYRYVGGATRADALSHGVLCGRFFFPTPPLHQMDGYR
jgi:hypothetical protein